MCAYFFKAEDEPSEAMKQAAKEASESNLSPYEQMKTIAKAYMTKRECSTQEAVYHIMPELWLRKTYPDVVFVNTNLPEKRFRVCCNEEELRELPEDSPNIYKCNMLDRYVIRPNTNFLKGKYAAIDSMCYAEFCAYYYIDSQKWNENDSQPELFDDQEVEKNHESNSYTATTLPLMSDKKERLKCRKTKAVLRYHVPNANKRPEKYAQYLVCICMQ